MATYNDINKVERRLIRAVENSASNAHINALALAVIALKAS